MSNGIFNDVIVNGLIKVELVKFKVLVIFYILGF